MYYPLNYEKINLRAGTTSPANVKSFNNKTFNFWCRSLFQRACSVLEFDLPEDWNGTSKDYFYYCLYKFGYVAVFNNEKFGFTFQSANLSGYDWHYQPTKAIITHPLLVDSLELEIHKDCELIKLTPDYSGIWDIIEYTAEKLSLLDNAINMSLINNKFAFFIGARNKAAGEAIKKMLDKVNKGEPAIVYDMKLLNDPTDKAEPWQFLERSGLRNSYLTTDQLRDFQTIINNFDAEVGIPTIPYEKKERMVQSEAESRMVDSVSRSTVWLRTLTESINDVNAMFGSNISVKARFEEKGGDDDGKNDIDRSV